MYAEAIYGLLIEPTILELGVAEVRVTSLVIMSEKSMFISRKKSYEPKPKVCWPNLTLQRSQFNKNK